MMGDVEFTFFTTYVKGIEGIPVTVSYDRCSLKLVEELRSYPNPQFIHSGNPWSIPREKRTREEVLRKQEMLVNRWTVGIMSLNVPPSYERTDHWNLSREDRDRASKVCLENADWALRHKSVDVPLYCTIYVSSYEDAVRWFSEAVRRGHTHFCIGVAEFLMEPRHAAVGALKVLEVTAGARAAIGDRPLHISGVASLRLLPLLAYLGATSCDGSTPVTSALARRTVYDSLGNAYRVDGLRSWACDCEACRGLGPEEAASRLKESPYQRLRHNVAIWSRAVEEIRSSSRRELERMAREMAARTRSPHYARCLEYARRLAEKLGETLK